MFLSVVQVYHSKKESSKSQFTYTCPLAYCCGCDVKFKICRSMDAMILMSSGVHTGSSHVKDSSVCLKVSHKASLKRLTKCAPNESARQLVRNSSNLSPDRRVNLSPKSVHRAQRIIGLERRRIAQVNSQGVKLDQTFGSMIRLRESLDLQAFIDRHNDPDDDFHLDLHQVVCIGNQWSGRVTFMELTTPHFIFNIGSAIQSGWEMQLQADGSFNFCASNFGIILFCVNSLRSIFRYVAWSIVPNESSEAFEFAYNGFRVAFFSLFAPGKLRVCDGKCALCDQFRDIQSAPEVIAVLANPEQRLPVVKAICDNITKFSKFVKRVLA